MLMHGQYRLMTCNFAFSQLFPSSVVSQASETNMQITGVELIANAPVVPAAAATATPAPAPLTNGPTMPQPGVPPQGGPVPGEATRLTAQHPAIHRVLTGLPEDNGPVGRSPERPIGLAVQDIHPPDNNISPPSGNSLSPGLRKKAPRKRSVTKKLSNSDVAAPAAPVVALDTPLLDPKDVKLPKNCKVEVCPEPQDVEKAVPEDAEAEAAHETIVERLENTLVPLPDGQLPGPSGGPGAAVNHVATTAVTVSPPAPIVTLHNVVSSNGVDPPTVPKVNGEPEPLEPRPSLTNGLTDENERAVMKKVESILKMSEQASKLAAAQQHNGAILGKKNKKRAVTVVFAPQQQQQQAKDLPASAYSQTLHLANGGKAAPAQLQNVQHVEQVMEWTPSPDTLDGSSPGPEDERNLKSAVNGDRKPTKNTSALGRDDRQNEPSTSSANDGGSSQPRTSSPHPDTNQMQLNLNLCQASIQQILHSATSAPSVSKASGQDGHQRVVNGMDPGPSVVIKTEPLGSRTGPTVIGGYRMNPGPNRPFVGSGSRKRAFPNDDRSTPSPLVGSVPRINSVSAVKRLRDSAGPVGGSSSPRTSTPQPHPPLPQVHVHIDPPAPDALKPMCEWAGCGK